jgi:hypothetical protein
VTRFHYRFYGLTLSTNRRLPRLTRVGPGQPPDVRLDVTRLDSLPCANLRWIMPDPPRPLWRARTDRGSFLRLRYSGLDASAEFVIDDTGKSVWASWSEGVAIEEAAELFLGPVFSCVLGQRGLTCLHASVVQIDDRVVALVGGKGAGKSTTLLALVQRGGRVVSDDVAILTETGGRLAVCPGEPRVRMRPDSAAALCGSFQSLRPMWINEDTRPAKRYVDLPSEASAKGATPLPLDALYLLAPRSSADRKPSVRSLSGAEALARLMSDRHMAGVLEPEGHKRDFALLAKLVQQIPTRELLRPDGLHATEQTVDVVLADARAPA